MMLIKQIYQNVILGALELQFGKSKISKLCVTISRKKKQFDINKT